MKCEFDGCGWKADFRCHRLWGKGGTICTCHDHTPANGREEYPKPGGERLTQFNHLRPFYRIEPIPIGEQK